eukprot:243775-Amphidinium_carterae.1
MWVLQASSLTNDITPQLWAEWCAGQSKTQAETTTSHTKKYYARQVVALQQNNNTNLVTSKDVMRMQRPMKVDRTAQKLYKSARKVHKPEK